MTALPGTGWLHERVGRTASNVAMLRSLADPRTMKRLRESGMVGPLSPLAIAASVPWVLGRGSSLGVVTQMNSIAVGNKTAIVDRSGTMTWRELDRRGNRVARALRRMGLRGGDRVAILLRNSREFVEVVVGAQKVGLVACPMNTWAKPRELSATLENAHASVLFYDAKHAEQVAAAAPDDLPLVVVGDGAAGTRYDDFLDGSSDAPVPPFTRDPGSTRIVIHTSGTSGTPKGASRDDAAGGIRSFAKLLDVLPYRRSDVVYVPAPMFHSFGYATFAFGAVVGATMVLPEKFDPERSLALIEEHRVTAASLVPVMIKRILDLDPGVKARYDLSSLRIVVASGSAMSPKLRRAATELFGDVLYDLYGSTETGWVAIATPADIAAKPTSVGRAAPGIEIGVFAPGGERAAPGEPGELFVRSDLLFEGYTSGGSRPTRDGFVSIGDVGRVDEEGYIFVEGRADDMVVVGGENVYPIEIESLIESIDGVREAAVMGVEDEEYGEVLAAFVAGSASPDDVVATCQRELASYKVPKRVEIVDELPRTATGKVLKRRLVERLDGAEPLDD
ncbi:MAG TPA: AMP-binding protein [Actinomycetota bacterium]|nr:AMP-binding protein [Actinomycetota bacterium]